MGLEERVYSVLVVSAAERFNAALSEMLPQSLFSPVRFVRGVSIAKQAIAERDFDLVLLYAPLPDDPGVEFAVELCTTAGTVVLLLMRPELYAETRDEAAESGVFSLPRPVSRQTMQQALFWMIGARERLRGMERKTLSFAEKMAEIRLVNRAKCIGILRSRPWTGVFPKGRWQRRSFRRILDFAKRELQHMCAKSRAMGPAFSLCISLLRHPFLDSQSGI